MKINHTNQTNFGNSKTLDKVLKKTLKQHQTPFTNGIESLNLLCNRLEDSITMSQKKNLPAYETDSLIDFFIDLKTALAEAVEHSFPKIDYTGRESRNYTREVQKKGHEWKLDVKNALDESSEYMGERNRADIDNACSCGDDILSKNTPNKIAPSEQKDEKEVIMEHLANSESPKGFSSIGGMEKLKQNLFDKIISPIINPELAKLDELEYGKKFPRATLLFGPPGNGKTFIAEAVAREAGVPFFKLEISQVGAPFINKTSENYETAFMQVEAKSKEIGKPCILFLDELDGITKNRGSKDSTEDLKQVGTLLKLINEARSRGIIIIGATNKYDLIDEAFKSRFDNQEFVGMPDVTTRLGVLKKQLEGKAKAAELLASEKDLEAVAVAFEGFSNRTITDLSAQAGLLARNDGRRNIQKEDFLSVIKNSQTHKVENGDEDYAAKTTRVMGFSKRENA